jgi:hypothetical protein
MLEHNSALTKLDLHWNSLKGQAIVKIFEGIKRNATLLNLDLSWNAMGSAKESELTA